MLLSRRRDEYTTEFASSTSSLHRRSTRTHQLPYVHTSKNACMCKYQLMFLPTCHTPRCSVLVGDACAPTKTFCTSLYMVLFQGSDAPGKTCSVSPCICFRLGLSCAQKDLSYFVMHPLSFRALTYPQRVDIRRYVFVVLRGACVRAKNRHTCVRIPSGGLLGTSCAHTSAERFPVGHSITLFLYPSPCPSVDELAHRTIDFHVLISALTAEAVALVTPKQR